MTAAWAPSVLSEDAAEAVYDALVGIGGAPASAREDFVAHATTEGVEEWRFQGFFGSGGVFRADRGEWYTMFYVADTTKERERRHLKLNAELERLRQRFRPAEEF